MMLRHRKETNFKLSDEKIRRSDYETIEEPIGDALFGHYVNENTKLVKNTYPGCSFCKIYHCSDYRVYYNNKDYKILCHNYRTYLRYCELKKIAPVSKLKFYTSSFE